MKNIKDTGIFLVGYVLGFALFFGVVGILRPKHKLCDCADICSKTGAHCGLPECPTGR